MNEKLLLLSSSSPFFENYDLHDSIYQSLIDLEEEKSKDEIMELLIKAQQSLNENIDDSIVDDIFSLMLKCYSYFPCDFIPILEQLYSRSRNNLNYTIITVSILSYYIQNNYSSYLFDFKSFVIEIINNINSFINHNVNLPFELNFLLDILIISDLNDHFIQFNILPIFNYIFLHISKNQNFYNSYKDQIIFLIKKVIRVSFFNIICNFLPINEDTYLEMNTDDLTFLIPLIPNELFIKLFHLNEKILLKSTEISLPFVSIFLSKCQELNLKIKSIDQLFESLSFEEIVHQIIDIAQKYELDLPTNITIYNNTIISLSILSEISFYIDILSNLCENKLSAAMTLTKSFAKYFQKIIKKGDFNDKFDEIFLSTINSNQNNIEILINLLNFLDDDYLKYFYQKEHMHNLISMILQIENNLPYSLIKVIDRYSIYTFISKRILLNIQITPRIFYIFKFSNKKANKFKPNKSFEQNFTYRLRLNISTTTNLDNPQLISFIKNNDYNLLTTMNDESLSFIIKALIFAENEKCSIIGLTSNNVIPFYAIVLGNLKIFDKNYYTISEDRYIDMFFMALKTQFNSSSPIIRASICSILKSQKITKSISQFNIRMFDILIIWLLSNTCDLYKTDIINYLISDINKLKYIKTNLNELIKFILKENRFENALFMDMFMHRYNYFKASFHIFKAPLSYFDENKIMNFDLLIEHFLTNYNFEKNDTVINYIFLKLENSYQYNSKDTFNNLGRSIIDHLFALINHKKWSYQSFYCLECIAYTYIYLLEKNPYQIFESVLPELENYLILFEKNNDNENKAKTAICALSFLISSLRSQLIMDEFINWYFSRIEQFTAIQIFCFNYIFNSIFDINGLKHILVSIFKKYNYEEVLSDLIQKDSSHGVFHYSYALLLKSLINKFTSFSKNPNIYCIPISELEKVKTPFVHELKIVPFLPLNQITKNSFQNLPQTQLNMNFFVFMEEIERIKTNKNRVKKGVLSSGFIEYNYHSTDFVLEFEEPCSIISDYYRYIYNKSPWIYYMVAGNKINLYNLGDKIKEKLETIIKENQNDDIDLFTSKCISFNLATNIFSLTENDFSKACKYIFSFNEEDINIFMKLLEKQFYTFIEKEKKKENTYNYLNRLLSVFVLISKFERFKQSYYNFEEILLDIILKPKYRNDEKILSKIADMLIDMKLNEISLNFFHVTNFMYKTKNEDLIYKATKISKVYFVELLRYNIEKIKYLYLSEIKRDELSFSKIIELLDWEPCLKGLDDNILFLDRLLNEFDRTHNYYKNEYYIKLINLFTPDRNTYDLDSFSDLDESETEEFSIPPKLLNSDPTFWNYFLENRIKIFKIIIGNQYKITNLSLSFKIIDEYSEFFPFLMRYKWFIEKTYNLYNYQIYELLIDRENIIESSLSQLNINDLNIWRPNFKIKYLGQIGVDYGGLRKDWFTKLSRELFNPNLGLFSITDEMKYHPNAQSYANSNHLQLFKFCGILIAKAILQKENVDVHLSSAFLCRVLGRNVGLNDIREIDNEIFRSLHFLLNNDLNLYDGYEGYFVVDHNNFGKIETYELIENGGQIRITNENKYDYVKCMIDYYSKDSIDCQIQAFCEGFNSLIQQKYIKIFSPNELDLLISGISSISVDFLKENTIYEFPYTNYSPPVVLFFNSISKWDQPDLKKLLMFITGSPNLPFTGLNRPIKIQCGGEKDRLPVAHTCFNTLCLPKYENEEQLNFKFLQAFAEESSDFLLI